MSRVAAIWKQKGDPSAWRYYRYIVVTSCLCKLYERVIDSRDRTWMDPTAAARRLALLQGPTAGVEAWSATQGGFRPEHGCPEQVYMLLQAIKQRFRHRKPLFVAFVDLWKAFPSTNRKALLVRLQQAGICGKLWRIHRDLGRGLLNYIMSNGVKSDCYEVDNGLREGSSLSPGLFLDFIDAFIKELERRGLGSWMMAGADFAQWIGALCFADDIALVADSPEELQCMLHCLTEFCRVWQLLPSPPKCEVVVFGPKSLWRRQGGVAKVRFLTVGGVYRAAARYHGQGAVEALPPAPAPGSQGGQSAGGVGAAGRRKWTAAHNDQCEVCGSGGSLLCCDFCNLVFHLDCLDPPLAAVPEGDWACPECVAENEAGAAAAEAKARPLLRPQELPRLPEVMRLPIEVHVPDDVPVGQEWANPHWRGTPLPEGVRITQPPAHMAGVRRLTLRIPASDEPGSDWAAATSWTLWGSRIHRVAEYKYLGVWLHMHLDWKRHLRHVQVRAFARLTEIKAIVGHEEGRGAPLSMLVGLYRSYVLGALLYGLEFCSRGGAAVVNRVNKHFVVGVAKAYHRGVPSSNLRRELGLASGEIEVWRKHTVLASILQKMGADRYQGRLHRHYLEAVSRSSAG